MTKREISRIPCTQEVFKNIRFYLQAKSTYFISGHSSMFVPSRNEKYILSHRKDGVPVARLWPAHTGELLLMSPGEAARLELERAFPALDKVGWQGKHIKLLDWRSPMFLADRLRVWGYIST